MKKDKGIDNPWALSWYMKNQGYKPHKKHEDEEDAEFDQAVQAAQAGLAALDTPDIYAAAARCETWACVKLLDAQAAPVLRERPWRH
jgi:hypothetical protein